MGARRHHGAEPARDRRRCCAVQAISPSRNQAFAVLEPVAEHPPGGGGFRAQTVRCSAPVTQELGGGQQLFAEGSGKSKRTVTQISSPGHCS